MSCFNFWIKKTFHYLILKKKMQNKVCVYQLGCNFQFRIIYFILDLAKSGKICEKSYPQKLMTKKPCPPSLTYPDNKAKYADKQLIFMLDPPHYFLPKTCSIDRGGEVSFLPTSCHMGESHAVTLSLHLRFFSGVAPHSMVEKFGQDLYISFSEIKLFNLIMT